MVLAVPKGHPLTKQESIRLRDLRNVPFVWFHRWVNPTVYDQLMDVCARRGLRSLRVVQEATDRDTVLGLVQCQIGIAWITESTRWHCPRGIALLPVVDMDVRLPSLIWSGTESIGRSRHVSATIKTDRLAGDVAVRHQPQHKPTPLRRRSTALRRAPRS
jgi:DNA-binding transcriptional LysR family regulator